MRQAATALFLPSGVPRCWHVMRALSLCHQVGRRTRTAVRTKASAHASGVADAASTGAQGSAHLLSQQG